MQWVLQFCWLKTLMCELSINIGGRKIHLTALSSLLCQRHWMYVPPCMYGFSDTIITCFVFECLSLEFSRNVVKYCLIYDYHQKILWSSLNRGITYSGLGILSLICLVLYSTVYCFIFFWFLASTNKVRYGNSFCVANPKGTLATMGYIDFKL